MAGPNKSFDSINTAEATVGNDPKTDSFGVHRLVSKTPSSQSTVELTEIDGTYDRYVIDFTDFVPSDDGVGLKIQVSTDGGSTWKTGTSAYEWSSFGRTATGTNLTDNADGDSSLQVAGPVGNAPEETCSGEITLMDPNNGSVDQLIQADAQWIAAGGTPVRGMTGGSYTTPESYNAVRLQFGSGNIADSSHVILKGVIS